MLDRSILKMLGFELDRLMMLLEDVDQSIDGVAGSIDIEDAGF